VNSKNIPFYKKDFFISQCFCIGALFAKYRLDSSGTESVGRSFVIFNSVPNAIFKEGFGIDLSTNIFLDYFSVYLWAFLFSYLALKIRKFFQRRRGS